MSVIDPLARLRADRSRARDAGDGNAGLCTFATLGLDGVPAVRTLVLRDLELPQYPDALGVFVNASSGKWAEVQANGPRAGVLVWLPSVQVQYRLRVTLHEIDKSFIDDSWRLRPIESQRLDQVYERHPQGSPIESRAALQALVAAVDDVTLAPTPGARGWRLAVERVKILDLQDASRLHDRRRYERDGEGWRETVLVP